MDRRKWRAAVRKSRLPYSTQVALLTHTDLSRHHFHDEQDNLHAFARRRLAEATRQDERVIRRHLHRAQEAGWLLRHDVEVHRGMQVRFHYTTPDSPEEPCSECSRRGTGSAAEGGQSPAPEGGQNPVSKGDR